MYLGDFAEDATVYLMFNTFTSDDPSASSTITNLINTDVHIHKDDGLTQRNNAAGITVSVDFDGITGSHMIKIDTSDDTVGGFWVTGSDYFVRIEGTTIDAATVNAMVGQFSIENRYNPVTDYDGPTKAEMDTAHALLATGAICTETRLAELDAANLPTDLSTIAGYADLIDDATDGLAAIKAEVEGLAGEAMRGTDDAALASGVDLTSIHGSALSETSAGYLAAAFVKLFDVATPLLVASVAMKGTDSAALASVCTEARLAELAAANMPTDLSTIQTYVDLIDDATNGLAAIKAEVEGLAGEAMRGTDSAALASVCTEGRLAELDAANLPTDISGLNDISTADVATELATYAGPTKAEMDTAHALLATPAEVNAEVVDALNVDTYAEPGQGAPAATASLVTKIGYLFKLLRNKIETTATTISVYDDAGTTVDQASTISDDATTFTRGEFGTGA